MKGDTCLQRYLTLISSLQPAVNAAFGIRMVTCKHVSFLISFFAALSKATFAVNQSCGRSAAGAPKLKPQFNQIKAEHKRSHVGGTECSLAR